MLTLQNSQKIINSLYRERESVIKKLFPKDVIRIEIDSHIQTKYGFCFSCKLLKNDEVDYNFNPTLELVEEKSGEVIQLWNYNDLAITIAKFELDYPLLRKK